jgi:hypothetical protein
MSEHRLIGFLESAPQAGTASEMGRTWHSPTRKSVETKLITHTNSTQVAAGDQPVLREVLELHIEKQFALLAEQWHNESGYDSSMIMRKRHPAYQELVSLGWAIVPMLLDALITTPDFWFPILRDITGENPVPEEERGFYDLMTDRWRVWGQQKGLLM